MRNETIPASLLDTTMDVMSGAAGSSPVESLKVTEFAAWAAVEDVPSGPPTAAAGKTTHAIAKSARNVGDRSRPTWPGGYPRLAFKARAVPARELVEDDDAPDAVLGF